MLRSVFTSILILLAVIAEIARADQSEQYRAAKMALELGNLQAALELLESAARSDDLDAYNLLGVIYTGKYGQTEDRRKSAEYYRYAADKGHGPSQHNLAVAYETGRGVRKDDVLAAKYHSQAAEQGYVASMYRLARLLEQGKGVAQDVAQAIIWYQKSANRRYAPAAYSVGRIYFNGKKAPRDIKRALHYMQIAAESNYRNARELVPKIVSKLPPKDQLMLALAEQARTKPPDEIDPANPFRDHRPSVAYVKLISDLSEKYKLGEGRFFVKEDARAELLEIGVDFAALKTFKVIPWKGVLMSEVQERSKAFSEDVLADVLASDAPLNADRIKVTLVERITRTEYGTGKKTVLYKAIYGVGILARDAQRARSSNKARQVVAAKAFKTDDILPMFRR